MGIKSSLYPINILGHDSFPELKVQRWPFTDVGTETIDVMQVGYLVKMNAAGTGVEPALAADDAALAGIILDLPGPEEVAPKTVAVAFQGTFNANQVHYANAHSQTPPAALSVPAVNRLRELNIFLEPAVPAGAFAP
jgi:hypothetical protein